MYATGLEILPEKSFKSLAAELTIVPFLNMIFLLTPVVGRRNHNTNLNSAYFSPVTFNYERKKL